MSTIKQDIIIWKCVEYNDPLLHNQQVYFDKNTQEICSPYRETVIYKLNELGYRVLQFIHDEDTNIVYGESILVEKVFN